MTENSGDKAAAEAPAPDAGAVTAADIERLQAEVDQARDRYLRTAAELDNLRKRSAREVENARAYGIERFASELLAVVDSLEMGVSAGADATADALLEGGQATLRLLFTTLDKFGVGPVDPLGEPFDPQLHEAMATRPSDSAEPGTVLTVVQKGYTLNGRLLRPARVIVAAEPPAPADAGSGADNA
ncbi:MAG: nucleotide exchange factor GrpE [Chromatiales bacterium]|nr:MAG: nucleotide exchange factor GrpE [Chromatiales bacterium]